MVGAHASGGVHQRFAACLREAGEGRLQLAARDLQPGHAGHFDAIQATVYLDYRGVAAPFDVGQDRGHRPVDVFVLRVLEGEQSREPRIEVGIQRAE